MPKGVPNKRYTPEFKKMVAEILGTSRTMYARYERSANEMPVRHLITLCKYYHVSADIVLGLKKRRHG